MVQSVLITGAGSGIGEALALEFHSKGLRVFATARTLSKLQHLDDVGIHTLELEVTDSESIRRAVSVVQETTNGHLDFLVNNSGVGYSMPLLDSSLTEARKLYDVNVFGLVAVTQAFAMMLIAAKGKVINISSIGSKTALPYMGFYNGTKAAVNSISDTLRMELAPFDVKVITVVTGAINTPFFASQLEGALPEGSLYKPVEAEFEEFTSKAPKEAMNARDYAKGVVVNALRDNSAVIFWRGGSAGAVRIAAAVAPTWFPDWLLSKTAKLDLLKGRLGN
jgi:1-acylglycerone phosphate reductase